MNSKAIAWDVGIIAKELKKIRETLEKLLKHLQENVIQVRDRY